MQTHFLSRYKTSVIPVFMVPMNLCSSLLVALRLCNFKNITDESNDQFFFLQSIRKQAQI